LTICSIIIRTYNQEKHIGKLLYGISVQTIQDYEIILVDSGSTDATIGIAKNYNAKIIHIPPEEFTFGRAINQGIKNAKGKYCILVSAHAYPAKKDWLENLIKILDRKTVLVYGKQRGDERSKFSERRIFLKWFPEHSIKKQDNPFCNNANAAIKRRVWKRFLYNEKLSGLEDLDWAKRVMKKGYNIAYCAEAEIVHIHEETYKQTRRRYEREAMALKTIMPNMGKFTLRSFFSLFFRNIWSDCKAAWKQKCLFKNFVGIIRFRFNQFYGTYKGYKVKTRLTEKLRKRYYFPAEKVKPKDIKDGMRINYSD